jgi:LacI family transcriptional regulator, galactose operon repressor
MQRKITQQGIAEALGLSLKTVQRTFAGSQKVSAETRSHIRAYAAEVGYTPNRGARALVRGGLRSIRLFSSASPGYFWNKVTRGVGLAQRQIIDFGYRAIHHAVPARDTAAYIQALNRALGEGMDAAAVVNNPEYDMTRIFGFLDLHKTPYITLNIDAPETQRIAFVGPDYGEGGRMAAEFMGKVIPEQGRILIIHNPVDSGHALAGAHMNEERLLQFVAYLSIHFPRLEHQVVSFGSSLSPAEIEAELAEILFETGTELKGIYSIASMHDILGGLILKHSLEGRYKIVVHGISPRTEMYLRSHAFTAALHQNPILQGYYAVRILEKYLETGFVPPGLPTVAQGIVLGSNIGEEENFALFASLFAIDPPEPLSRP